MKRIFSLVTLLLLTVASYAHIWEIRVNQAQNGTLTWYLQSYHSIGECGIANSGLTINGTNYPLQSEHSGSIVGLSNTVLLPQVTLHVVAMLLLLLHSWVLPSMCSHTPITYAGHFL